MPRAKATPDALLFGGPNRLDGWGFQYTVEPAAAGSRAGETVLYASVSSDDGATWSDAAPTDVPNPNAKVCLLSNATRPLLAYNDDTSGRSPLSVAAASPDAAKWTKLVDVEPRADKESFAYPTIRRKTTGEVLVSYSYNYRGIKAAHITGLGV
jgi:predicted neuraminidase